jgi:hypothetical protein
MKNTSWSKGPIDHITCEPPHDRPIFSLATSSSKFVTGSADHGLREYNMYFVNYLDKMVNISENFLVRSLDIKNG